MQYIAAATTSKHLSLCQWIQRNCIQPQSGELVAIGQYHVSMSAASSSRNEHLPASHFLDSPPVTFVDRRTTALIRHMHQDRRWPRLPLPPHARVSTPVDNSGAPSLPPLFIFHSFPCVCPLARPPG